MRGKESNTTGNTKYTKSNEYSIQEREHQAAALAILSTLPTSLSNSPTPSSNHLTYSTALNSTPLFPLVRPLPLAPLPFGRPLVGIPLPGGAPAGANNVVSAAYPSRIAFRLFCSDNIWFNLFCGDESRAFFSFAAADSSSPEPGERERELDAAAFRFDGARVDFRVCVCVGVEGDASELDESCDSSGCGNDDKVDPVRGCVPPKFPRSDPNDGESNDEPNAPASDDEDGGGSSSDC